MEDKKQIALYEGWEVLHYDNDTLFLNMGKLIYSNQGFVPFSQYYLKINTFKNELDIMLLEYYCYLDLNYTKGIKENIKKLIYLMDTFKIDIYQSFLEGDIENSTKINEYFYKKKSDVGELDPEKNGRLCVSKLQVEWAKINYEMENYYESIKKNINRPIEKKLQKGQGIMGRFFNAIASVSETGYTNEYTNEYLVINNA